MNYICHSGGCPGSDIEWETQGKKYGVKTIAYSFHNHIQEGENRKILTPDELEEGWFHVMIANKTLKRNPQGQPQYIKNLLSRNWFQVKNSEAIFAIGKFLTKETVKGGTGWAVQMAIDNRKMIFVFNQDNGIWYRYQYNIKKEGFVPNMQQFNYSTPTTNIPFPLPQNFAGIGTRDINDDGKKAIKDVLKYNFGPIV